MLGDQIIQLADRLFWHVLSSTPAAAAIIVAIVAVRRWLGSRLNASVLYSLWFVLMARLLLPWSLFPSPGGMLSLWNAMPQHVLTLAAEGMRASPAEELARAVESNPRLPSPARLLDGSLAPVAQQLLNAAFALWLLGAVALLLLYLVSAGYWRLNVARKLNLGSGELADELACCRQQLGMSKQIHLQLAEGLGSPIATGWLRPTIYVPVRLLDQLEATDWRSILTHELIRIRRRDLLWNHVMALLLILHWFNPLMWLASRKMREDQELSCDSRVMDHVDNRQYGFTLLKLAAWRQSVSLPGWLSWLPSYAGTPAYSLLDRRMLRVRSYVPGRPFWRPFVLLTMAVILIISMTGQRSAALPWSRMPNWGAPAAGTVLERYDAEHPYLLLATEPGTTVHTAASGRIEEAAYTAAEGGVVRITHLEGYETEYRGLDNLQVVEGERVSDGQAIGTSRSAAQGEDEIAEGATGGRLQFAVSRDGQPLDPLAFIYGGSWSYSALAHDWSSVLAYASPYMGDASNLMNLNNHLPLGGLARTYQLDSDERGAEIQFKEVLTDGDEQEFNRAVMYVSTANFVLIGNLQQLRLNYDGYSYDVRREEVEQWYGIALEELRQPEVWERLVRAKLIDPSAVDDFIARNVHYDVLEAASAIR